MKCFQVEFSFKAFISNQGCLPFAVFALDCSGPATPISVYSTWSERENSAAERRGDQRNLDFQPNTDKSGCEPVSQTKCFNPARLLPELARGGQLFFL